MSSLLIEIDNLEAGPDDYSVPSGHVLVKLSESPEQKDASAKGLDFQHKVIDGVPTAVLINSVMRIEIALKAGQKDSPEHRCFGGAIRRVRLAQPAGQVLFGFHDELLEYKHPEEEHAQAIREIRCLQVDRIYLWDAEQQAVAQQNVFDSDFEVVCSFKGPLRVGCTLASRRLFELPVASHEGYHYTYCRLFRTLSLDHDGDFLLDRMWVRPVDAPSRHLEFRARLFSLLFWPNLEYRQITDPPQFDWLALRCNAPQIKFEPPFGRLRSSLAYCTDAHTVRLRRHPYWPVPASHDFVYSWETQKTCLNTSATKFMFSESMDECAHAIGELWHRQLFKPLLGRRI